MTNFFYNKRTILMAVCALVLAVVSLFSANLLRDNKAMTASAAATSTDGHLSISVSGNGFVCNLNLPAEYTYAAIEINGVFAEGYERVLVNGGNWYLYATPVDKKITIGQQFIGNYPESSGSKSLTLVEGNSYNFVLMYGEDNSFEIAEGTYLSSILFEQFYLPPNPSKVGYDFIGWYLNEQLTIPYQGETITKDMNFYAKFSPLVYNISYNLNGGSLTGSPNSYTIESNTFNLSEPTRTGYTFGGWFENAGLTGSAVTTISKGTTGNKTYWAKWTATNYTITYNLEGGSLTGQPTGFTIESAAVSLPNPTRTGYTFGGWYASAGLTGDVVTIIPAGSIGDKAYWAKWTINRYTVSFVTNGGSAVSSITTDYNTVISNQTTSREGHTFDGWFTDENFATPFSFTSAIVKDMTLYAKFTINKYTVTFWVDGVEYATMVVEWGSTLGAAVQQMQAKVMQFITIPESVDLSTQIFSDAELEVEMATEGWDKAKANIDYILKTYATWFILGGIVLVIVLASVGAAQKKAPAKSNYRYRRR